MQLHLLYIITLNNKRAERTRPWWQIRFSQTQWLASSSDGGCLPFSFCNSGGLPSQDHRLWTTMYSHPIKYCSSMIGVHTLTLVPRSGIYYMGIPLHKRAGPVLGWSLNDIWFVSWSSPRWVTRWHLVCLSLVVHEQKLLFTGHD